MTETEVIFSIIADMIKRKDWPALLRLSQSLNGVKEMDYEEQLDQLSVDVIAAGGQGGAELTLNTSEQPSRRYGIYVRLAGDRWIKQYGPTFDATLASVRRMFEAGDFSG